MKDTKPSAASMDAHRSSKMSDFFRYGSAEEKRDVYFSVATTAIREQMDVVRAANAGEIRVEKDR